LAKPRHVPERRCVACGQHAPKRNLTRIVRTPQGTVHADATGKSSGRGAYLCSSMDCWEKGVRRGGLERNLQVTIAPRDRDVLLDYFRERVARATPVEG
jgi:predicted RNA-binding protein YlxR (DUF448 family)